MTRSSPDEQVSTQVAAELVGMTTEQFYVAMHRARKRGIDLRVPKPMWTDARTPAWDKARLLEWDRDRQRGPGRPRGRRAQHLTDERTDGVAGTASGRGQ